MDAADAQDSLPPLQRRREELQAALAAPAPKAGDQQKEHDRLRNELADIQDELCTAQALIDELRTDDALAATARQHADIREQVLQETARLHANDAMNLEIWKQVLPACRDEIQRVYQRLSVTFDFELGESFYHDQLPAVVESLTERGIATESDGAVCVFLDGFESPMIVQKRDGAFLYATSDLATIDYRVRQWQPDAIIYVVDARQWEHFAKLFAAARKWGHDQVELRHISFGTILGKDHRPFRTRSGDTVGLESLLDEAERRAYAVICEIDGKKDPREQLDEPTRRKVAAVVGIAALKYADLSQNRTSDYVFDYDKMLSLQGNTATYLQYSYARVHGIFQRGNVDTELIRQASTPLRWVMPEERALAIRLVQFGEAFADVLVDYRPNLLTNYLYDLAKVFSSFFEECPVLAAETPELRTSRLQLVDLTARTMRLGLNLLGIDVVQKM
jgi:arginyl-tRNA synthetase